MSMNHILNKYRDLTNELMEGAETNVEIDISVLPSKFAELKRVEPDMVANPDSEMEYLRYAEGGSMVNIFEDTDVQEDRHEPSTREETDTQETE